MAVFKCNEAANDQLIRLFVLWSGRFRTEDIRYIKSLYIVRVSCFTSYIR